MGTGAIIIEPNGLNGLRVASRMMVDKITTVPKSKAGERIGRLDDSDIVRLNQAMLVFLGLAVSPRVSRKQPDAPPPHKAKRPP